MNTNSHINIVVASNNTEVSRSLADSLAFGGYPGAVATNSVYGLLDAIAHKKPDILICDNELEDRKIAQLVRGVRQKKIGHNPFLLTVLIAESPGEDHIAPLINSGTDGIVVGPVTASSVLKWIEAFKRGRKEWVVTTQYIGPNRRDGARPDSEEIPLLTVPNSVKYKSAGKADMEDFQKSVEAATSLIEVHLKIRQAAHLDYLASQLTSTSSGEPIDYLVTEMKYTAENLLDWLSGASGDFDVVEPISKLIETAEKMLGGEDGGTAYFHNLAELSVRIKYDVAKALGGTIPVD